MKRIFPLLYQFAIIKEMIALRAMWRAARSRLTIVQSKYCTIVLFLFLLSACSGKGILPDFHLSGPMQCVPFAREASGIEIYGNAHTWWDKAAGKYARGHKPKAGAVMVLSRTKKMRHGHVATVVRVVNARLIEVTHTNWGDSRSTRRKVYQAMPVMDISAKNDWSRVRLFNDEINDFGLPYPARGFIYP